MGSEFASSPTEDAEKNTGMMKSGGAWDASEMTGPVDHFSDTNIDSLKITIAMQMHDKVNEIKELVVHNNNDVKMSCICIIIHESYIGIVLVRQNPDIVCTMFISLNSDLD